MKKSYQVGRGSRKELQHFRSKLYYVAGGFFSCGRKTVMDLERTDQKQLADFQRIACFLQEEVPMVIHTEINFKLIMEMGVRVDIVGPPIGGILDQWKWFLLPTAFSSIIGKRRRKVNWKKICISYQKTKNE